MITFKYNQQYWARDTMWGRWHTWNFVCSIRIRGQMTKLNPGSQSAPPFSLYLRIFLSICFYLFNFAFDYYSFRLQQKEQSRPSWPTSIQEVHLVLPSDTSQVHLRSLCFVFPYLYILDCYFWVFVQLFCAAPDYFDCRKSIWSSDETPQKSIYAAFVSYLRICT